MNVVIYYFSGTGNTLWCAREFKRAFSSVSISVKLISIDEALRYNDVLNPSDFDLMGLGFPVHTFNAPELIYTFIGALPVVDEKKVFLFKTAVAPFLAGTGRKVKKMLTKKGFTVFHQTLLITPINVIKAYPPALCKALFLKCRKIIYLCVEDLLTYRGQNSRDGLFKALLCGLLSRGQWLWAKNTGKSFKVVKGCILCRKCYLNCPEKNISRKADTLYFGDNCSLCLRCISGCPVDVIKPQKHKWFFIRSYQQADELLNDESIDVSSPDLKKVPPGVGKWLKNS